MDEIQVEDVKLGEGSFGSVFCALYKNQVVAAKFQPLPDETELQRTLIAELSIFKNVVDPHLVRYIGAARIDPPFDDMNIPFSSPGILVLMEKCLYGDLRSVIEEVNGREDLTLSWPLRVRISHQIALGIKSLHAHGVIHRDIKTSNILLDDDWTAKVCDYGFAISSSTSKNSSYVAGTPEFSSPEVELGEEYSTPSDIFSFGLVLAEMITMRLVGKDGFLERKPQNLFRVDHGEISSNVHDDVGRMTSDLLQLCIRCSSFEPSDRPSLEDVIGKLEEMLDGMEDSETNSLNFDPPYELQDPSSPIINSKNSSKLMASTPIIGNGFEKEIITLSNPPPSSQPRRKSFSICDDLTIEMLLSSPELMRELSEHQLEEEITDFYQLQERIDQLIDFSSSTFKASENLQLARYLTTQASILIKNVSNKIS